MSAMFETATVAPLPLGSSTLTRGVLVLNRHWAAIHVCTVRRAVALVFQNLARVVTESYESYDFKSWRDLSARTTGGGEFIHTPQYALRIPEVIVLSRYNRMPPRNVTFNRRNIFLRDGFRCQYCGRRPRREELSIDHIVPRSRGGPSAWKNVVLACTQCNTRKGNRSPEEAGMALLRIPKRPHWLICFGRASSPRGRSVWERFVDKAYWNVDLDSEQLSCPDIG